MEIKQTKDTQSKTYLDAVKIRNSVFVKEQGVPFALEIDENESYCIHFVLYNSLDIAVATLRLLPQNNEQLILQRMAVLKEYRELGYAKLLIQEALKFTANNGYRTITLHAQLPARDFYKKIGFEEFGQVFKEAGIKHISMRKEL
ncbi:GNAT family N-acetyltransferase [Floricoccus penangensis]|uniref:GNAT family N-acetyltransferase n=1 Tax=Floricoccus penangensis TaxID=1859475 RepID=UPI002040FCA8|nr:GNAT family N-acetyltransferase [Floricoccus penangensis]URZ87234.1 GNAT family N-acetyltransferase [Floricoccus penangensis]